MFTTTEAVVTSFTNVSCYFDATFFTEDGVGDALSIAIASTLSRACLAERFLEKRLSAVYPPSLLNGKHLMGWDGIDCGDWCRHRSNECSMAHGSPSQQSNSLWVYRVIPENRHHHSGGVVTVVRAMPPEHPLRILTLILRFSLY